MNDQTRVWDVTGIRELFPALARRSPDGAAVAYLDGPGGTQVPGSVIAAMRDYLSTSNSNIEGEFELTASTDRLIEKARRYGGAFVGGDHECISFGQNMTSLNFNLSRALGRTLRAGDEIITTTLDHDGNVSPWILLAQDRGLVLRTVGVTEELDIDLDDLRSQLNERTKVVAFTLASNAVGTVTRAREISNLAHQVGALAWADAVAYAPHRRIDVDEIGCDVLLCSPYKFFGPHLGMSWIRRDLAESLPAERVRPAGLKPPGHRFETGTLSHEAIAGFTAAVDYLASLGSGADLSERLDAAYRAIGSHETALAERFVMGIRAVPRVRLAGPAGADPQRRVGTFGLIVDGGGTAGLARALGERGIYTWNGNFYALGIVQHLGLDVEDGLLRAGIVHYNTAADVDRFLAELAGLLS
ncbi:MAG TPA: cysteine desulfurase-like protein [Jiangellales bacterium]|nr:cysteine desulfurase-like protein [Jiangellales bacterium]